MLKLKTDSSLLTCEHSESQQKKKTSSFYVWSGNQFTLKTKTKQKTIEKNIFFFSKSTFFPLLPFLFLYLRVVAVLDSFLFSFPLHITFVFYIYIYIYILFCDLGCLRLLWYDPCRRCFFFFLSTLFCSFCEKVSLLLLSHFL